MPKSTEVNKGLFGLVVERQSRKLDVEGSSPSRAFSFVFLLDELGHADDWVGGYEVDV